MKRNPQRQHGNRCLGTYAGEQTKGRLCVRVIAVCTFLFKQNVRAKHLKSDIERLRKVNDVTITLSSAVLQRRPRIRPEQTNITNCAYLCRSCTWGIGRQGKVFRQGLVSALNHFRGPLLVGQVSLAKSCFQREWLFQNDVMVAQFRHHFRQQHRSQQQQQLLTVTPGGSTSTKQTHDNNRSSNEAQPKRPRSTSLRSLLPTTIETTPRTLPRLRHCHYHQHQHQREQPRPLTLTLLYPLYKRTMPHGAARTCHNQKDTAHNKNKKPSKQQRKQKSLKRTLELYRFSFNNTNRLASI